MAHRPCFFCWLLICWLVILVAKGQEQVTPPGVLLDDEDHTDCQIFTLTPPPITRKPVTRIQPITRTPKCPFHFFPTRRPRVHIRFPNGPFFPPKCKHRFHHHSSFEPHRRHPPHYRPFPRRHFRKESSSSEESREKRDAPNIRKQKKQMPNKRL